MFRPTRWEYRITLSDVDRGVNLVDTVVVSQHPSESTEHVVLRVLGFCLVAGGDARLDFGPGVCVGDAPDVVGHDLTGRMVVWVGCGDVPPDLARKVVQHNRDASVHVVLSRADRRDAFVERVAAWPSRPKGWPNLTLWRFPAELVDKLAAMEGLRQRWIVTLSGEHAYLEVDGVTMDGAIERIASPGDTPDRA